MDSWTLVLKSIEKRINRHSYRTWFQPTKIIDDQAGRLTVSVPNDLFLEWITSNYRSIVDEAVAELAPRVCSVTFACATGNGNGRSASRKASRPPRGSAAAAAAGESAPSPFNPRYTFESYVVSSCNQFAHAAARAVAEKPSHSYNPLYIYGGVGLGKTHLLHAIANCVRSTHTEAHLRYVSTENFMNELINAIRFEKTHEFKERYRSVDVLLIDDIQFLEGKERTQEEFFHTFNQLYELQKQIIISSDCPPREIPSLEERLRSRFEWGLIADIQPPDLETKIAILRKKAETEGVDLPQDVALYIAEKVRSNIRELEGCLLRVVAYASLSGRQVSLELATETLKDLFQEVARPRNIEAIQKFVADVYRLKPAELKAKNNTQQVVFPRQVAMYLSKELTPASLPEIGRRFGGKHHSTVLHAIRKIARRRESDPDFDRQVSGFLETLQ